MLRKKRIKNILSNDFGDSNIQVNDISFKHKGHNNFSGKDETHFSIEISIDIESKIKKIDIHKRIYKLLEQEFDSGLHALEIKILN